MEKGEPNSGQTFEADWTDLLFISLAEVGVGPYGH